MSFWFRSYASHMSQKHHKFQFLTVFCLSMELTIVLYYNTHVIRKTPTTVYKICLPEQQLFPNWTYENWPFLIQPINEVIPKYIQCKHVFYKFCFLTNFSKYFRCIVLAILVQNKLHIHVKHCPLDLTVSNFSPVKTAIISQKL